LTILKGESSTESDQERVEVEEALKALTLVAQNLTPDTTRAPVQV